MNMIRSAMALFSFSAMLAVSAGEITFTRLKVPPDSITEKFFQVGKGMRVEIKSEVIRSMQFEFEEGKSRARLGVFYKNTTSETASPKYTIRFYNPYGILMGGIRLPEDEKNPEASLEPDEEGVRALLPRVTRLDTLFKHADLDAYPKDFFTVRWISLSDANFK